MTLNGTLEDFSPAGILKVLSADGRTGAVRFGGPHGCTVYLHRGQLYFARDADTDECLATALVRPGRLSADAWGQAIDDSEDRPMVGELLVRAGAIAPDLLASVVLSVIYDPLIELFRDGTGEFDFEPDTVHWLGPFRAFPVDAIVDEVRKRAREVDEWSANIPSLDVRVEARRTLPGSAGQVTLRREEWELITALSGHGTIRDLAGELGRGAYSTARVVHRLQEASLVEVTANHAGHVVSLRRNEATDRHQPDPDDFDHEGLLNLGLPHRTSDSDATDPLTAHIGDAIAEALADADHVPVAVLPTLAIAPDLDDETTTVEPDEPSSSADVEINWDPETWSDETDEADDPDRGEGSLPQRTSHHDAPANDSWDNSRRVADGNALHHDGTTLTSLDEPRPKDPNAAWLADLYTQFIDDPESAAGPKKRRRGEPNPMDVAFKAPEQEGEEKVSTLKRLLGALKKL